MYALDSTTIELCLSLFPWAHSQRQKAAIKLHTLLDLRGNIPCFVRLSTAKTADSQILDQLIPEPGSFYVMDRGYNDFADSTAGRKQARFCRPLSKQYHLRPRRLRGSLHGPAQR